MNVEFLSQKLSQKLLRKFWKLDDLLSLQKMSHIKNIGDVWTTIEVCIHLKFSRQLLLSMIRDPLSKYIEISDHSASRFWSELVPRKIVRSEIKKHVSTVLLYRTAMTDDRAIEFFYRK